MGASRKQAFYYLLKNLLMREAAAKIFSMKRFRQK